MELHMHLKPISRCYIHSYNACYVCQFAVEAYNSTCFLFFLSLRATIEEVEGDVCELESKLDKVSTTHGKHCMIVHALHWETDCFCGNLVKS